MKCKNCGYENNNNKFKKGNPNLNKIEALMGLYNIFKLNEYNGELKVKNIWEDLKTKLINYEGNDNGHNITLKTLLNKLIKPPNKYIIDFIEELI